MANRLADSTSPYLRQHANNPVDWEEWGERAFQRAREEKKPILLSVGYAACHWCHVMAHESFENEAIAKLINEGFVAIKVDREERPDVDQIYQHAVQLLGVGGGWPLTAFLTPEGKPFYGGTYFPPDDRYGRPGFGRVLGGVRDAWTQRPEEVEEQAKELAAAVKELEVLPPESGEVVGDLVSAAGGWLLKRIDPQFGGFGGAPKFPNTMALEVVFRYARRSTLEGPREAVIFSLAKMAEGGIYDHVGGGFARYSVDETWHVPHFEKMLYDNSLLAKLYAIAWQATGLAWCGVIAEETLQYLLREMRAPSGAFYASTDADSLDEHGHPEEGAFFVWTEKEVMEVLGEEHGGVFALRYGVLPEGSWEHGKNVLHLVASEEDVAKETGRPLEEVKKILHESRTKLFLAREKRPRPFRDEKILTSWNGLAISALAFAGAAIGRKDFVEAAAKAADAVIAGAWIDGKGKGGDRLLRAPCPAGKAPILGTLDDYANFADALVDLWEATLHAKWLEMAETLADQAKALFGGEDGELFLTGSDGEKLMHRPRSLHDQSLPAGSAVLARVWLRLGRLLGREDFEAAARATIRKHRAGMRKQPFAFSSMLLAWDDAEHPVDVVLSGPVEKADALLAKLRARWVPGLALHVAGDVSAISKDKPPRGDEATIYVCKDQTCSLPVTTPEALEPLLAPGASVKPLISAP